jgi:signal transduction histidine kinase
MRLPAKGESDVAIPTVLVVDDNPANVELLEAYLLPEKYDVVSAFDGNQALARVAEAPPDIVLLDVMMPGLDGYEVCRRLKTDQKTRFIPVVMVTALKDLDDKVKSIEAGADDFLTKPISKVELLTRIRSLIRVKHLHDDLENSYLQLQGLQRTKEALTQMIIHDLKNPLTGIKANLEIVGMEKLDETRECLEAAQRSADLLYNMIQDLLDISRLEEGKLTLNTEAVALADVTSAVAREVEAPAAAEGKRISHEVPADLPLIPCDRNLIYRVVSNLLVNAVKHTGRGGSIALRAEVAGGFAAIHVVDTGHGIPEQFLDRIFEKFGQVDSRRRTGTGLGLTFCKMAVEAHGGTISVQSKEGVGSTFTFTLPLAGPSQEDSVPATGRGVHA